MDDFLDFGHEQSGDLHTYHCAVELAGDVLWPGLYEVYSEDRLQSPYFRFAINNNDGEALAVWRALAWAVTAGRSRFAIPCYYRDDAARLLSIEPADIVMIDWEYDVEAEPGSLSDVDRGFVPARSVVPIRPEPTSWERAHRAKAGFFELRNSSDLIALALAVGGDASSEITIFGLAGEDRPTRLVERLRGETRPRLQEILDSGDVIVDLAVDHDGYGRSHMSIRACEPLPEVEILTGHYRQAFHRYREAVSNIDDFEQFAMAIDQLLAPPPTTQTEPIT
ncbi:MAG: hypothetical protein P1T08_18480 [Acidimicrobiia bacterium]|nr:hypothetical protein [Acidimicrobiia bacterium]